jgi:hypothetical protein
VKIRKHLRYKEVKNIPVTQRRKSLGVKKRKQSSYKEERATKL